MENIKQTPNIDSTELGVKNQTVSTQGFRRCNCGWGFHYNVLDSRPFIECPYCGRSSKRQLY